MKRQFNQQGATLIYVLFMLLIITVLGTMAVREGVFSLKVATNSQIQALLSQSTNSAIFKIQNPVFLKGYLSSSGLFGFIRAPENYDKEMVFCFKESQTSFFDIDSSSVIYVPLGATAIKNDLYGKSGYCNPDADTNFFTNRRKIVMTQVSIKQAQPETSASPLADTVVGTDMSNAKIDQTSAFKVYVVSILPNVSNVSNAQIYECLSNRMSDPPTTVANETVTDCLAKLNVPYNTQTVTYKYAPGF